MKKIILVFLLSILMWPSFPQSSDQTKTKPVRVKNMGLSLTMDYSIVLGNYSKFSKDNTKSGFAANGWMANLTWDWLGKNFFGLAVQYAFQHHPLLDTAKNFIPAGTIYPLGSGAYNNHYLFIGPVYNRNFKRWMLDIKVLIGGVLSSCPVYNNTDPMTKQNVHNSGTGFAYQFAIAVGYQLAPNWLITLNVSYIGANPSKTKDYQYAVADTIWNSAHTEIIRIDYSTQVVEYTMKKEISTFNTGLGIRFKF